MRSIATVFAAAVVCAGYAALAQQAVALGVALIIAGCLGIAMRARRLPEVGCRYPSQPPTQMPTVNRWLVLGSLLSAVLVWRLCRTTQPSNAIVIVWLSTILLPILFLRSASGESGQARGETRPRLTRSAGAAVAIALTVLCLIAPELTAWRWSGLPDEISFFTVAESIARGSSERFLLSDAGVFDVHPVLGSAYQAAVMRMVGIDLFGWRFSSALAVAIAVPCLYAFAREMFGARVAIMTCALFASSPLVIGFGHLGYNNVQVYPIVTAALALFAVAQRRGSSAWYYLAGVVAGLGFYTFFPARLAMLLVILLAACCPAAGQGLGVLHCLWGFALTTAPAAAQGGSTLRHMLQFTSWDAGVAGGVMGSSGGANLLWQWMVALLYPIWFPEPHHFQSSLVVDPVAGCLAVVGLVVVLRDAHRHRAALFLATTFLLSSLLLASTSPFARPPLTRLLLLSPLVAMLGALGLDRLPIGGRARALLVAASVLGGVAVMQYDVRVRYHGYGDGTTAELIRLTAALPTEQTLIYVQRPDASSGEVDRILPLYRPFREFHYLKGWSASAADLLEQAAPPLTVVLELRDYQELAAAQQLVERRFPGHSWQDSDPGHFWSLRYLSVR